MAGRLWPMLPDPACARGGQCQYSMGIVHCKTERIIEYGYLNCQDYSSTNNCFQMASNGLHLHCFQID